MKAPVYDLDGNEKETIDLPHVFREPYNPVLIHKAVTAIQSHRFSPQGRDPLAGERTSAESWNTGRGVSRIARVRGRRGGRSGMAAGVASVVKGRLPQPPRSEKEVSKHLNRRERRVALLSSISASIKREVVSQRGHRLPEGTHLPIVLTDEIESLGRTKDLKLTLNTLGLGEELARVSKAKSPSGKPRLRGRKAKVKRGPLIIVSEDSGIFKAAGKLRGVDCVLASNLSPIHMAPGGHPGRLVLWSKSALDSLPRALYGMVDTFAS